MAHFFTALGSSLGSIGTSVGEGLSQLGGAAKGTMDWGKLLMGAGKLDNALSGNPNNGFSNLSDLKDRNGVWEKIIKLQSPNTAAAANVPQRPIMRWDNKDAWNINNFFRQGGV